MLLQRRRVAVALTAEMNVVWAGGEEEHKMEEKQRRTGGGVVDSVLELIVRFVLAGVQMVVVVRWVMSRVATVLEFVVELGMFLMYAPS